MPPHLGLSEAGQVVGLADAQGPDVLRQSRPPLSRVKGRHGDLDLQGIFLHKASSWRRLDTLAGWLEYAIKGVTQKAARSKRVERRTKIRTKKVWVLGSRNTRSEVLLVEIGRQNVPFFSADAEQVLQLAFGVDCLESPSAK